MMRRLTNPIREWIAGCVIDAMTGRSHLVDDLCAPFIIVALLGASYVWYLCVSDTGYMHGYSAGWNAFTPPPARTLVVNPPYGPSLSLAEILGDAAP